MADTYGDGCITAVRRSRERTDLARPWKRFAPRECATAWCVRSSH
jgi:hypothetical protein